MQNFLPQINSVTAWDGAAAPWNPITNYVQYNFLFTVTQTLTADAVFAVQSAPALGVGICTPDLTNIAPVNEVAVCLMPLGALVPQPAVSVTIPAGTKPGDQCRLSLPCKPNAFVQLVAVSGAANVRAQMIQFQKTF